MAEKLTNPYLRLLVQGQESGSILSVKIAAEQKILEAGSVLLEGIDRLFKIYWTYDLVYEPSCEIFYQFMQIFYGLPQGRIAKNVVELHAVSKKYVK